MAIFIQNGSNNQQSAGNITSFGRKPLKPVYIGRIYTHKNGEQYRVLDIVENKTRVGETCILYCPIENEKEHYVRSQSDFVEKFKEHCVPQSEEEGFINGVCLSREEIRNMVEEAMNKVYQGNDRENKGDIEDRCSDDIMRYYRGLARREQWAIDKCNAMAEEFARTARVEATLKDLEENE